MAKVPTTPPASGGSVPPTQPPLPPGYIAVKEDLVVRLSKIEVEHYHGGKVRLLKEDGSFSLVYFDDETFAAFAAACSKAASEAQAKYTVPCTEASKFEFQPGFLQ